MMNAREFLDASDLSSALTQASEQLRAKPADAEKRTLLFELLSFSGDLSRAAKQLEVVAQSGVEADVAVQRYLKVLAGEAKLEGFLRWSEQPLVKLAEWVLVMLCRLSCDAS